VYFKWKCIINRSFVSSASYSGQVAWYWKGNRVVLSMLPIITSIQTVSAECQTLGPLVIITGLRCIHTKCGLHFTVHFHRQQHVYSALCTLNHQCSDLKVKRKPHLVWPLLKSEELIQYAALIHNSVMKAKSRDQWETSCLVNDAFGRRGSFRT
jgi:hypothetical protein